MHWICFGLKILIILDVGIAILGKPSGITCSDVSEAARATLTVGSQQRLAALISERTEGGVEMGIYPHVAKEVVLQTLRGAIDLIEANNSHPEVEIDKVTTPGGITIKGLNEMEAQGFTNAVIKGLKASHLK